LSFHPLRTGALPVNKRETYAGFYAETCQSSGDSGRRIWQGRWQLATTARGSEEGGAKCIATMHTELLDYDIMIMMRTMRISVLRSENVIRSDVERVERYCT